MNISKIFEIIALLTSLVAFKAIRPLYLRILVPLLILTVAVENYFSKIIEVNKVYNVFSLVEMAVWFFIFFKILPRKNFRVGIAIAAILCFTYAFVEVMYMRSWLVFRTDSLRIYNLSIILFSTLYFFEINKKEYHNIFTDPLFWICTACFLFHLLFFFNNTIWGQFFYWKLTNAKAVYITLQSTANIIYYSLLCKGLLVCYYKFKLEQLNL